MRERFIYANMLHDGDIVSIDHCYYTVRKNNGNLFGFAYFMEKDKGYCKVKPLKCNIRYKLVHRCIVS